MAICMCSNCGLEVASGKRFRQGHNQRGKHNNRLEIHPWDRKDGKLDKVRQAQADGHPISLITNPKAWIQSRPNMEVS